MALFSTSHMSSYWCTIVTMALSCIITRHMEGTDYSVFVFLFLSRDRYLSRSANDWREIFHDGRAMIWTGLLPLYCRAVSQPTDGITLRRRPCCASCQTHCRPLILNSWRLLALLDMTAAFDCVDHGLLLQRLQRSFSLTGSVLQWINAGAG